MEKKDKLPVMGPRDCIDKGKDCVDYMYAIGKFPLHCSPGWRNDNWDGRSQWHDYYDYGRFTNEVYKKESDARSALIKEVSLEVARNGIIGQDFLGRDDFDVEFRNNIAKIVWKRMGSEYGQGDGICLRIEKIEVPARHKVDGDRVKVAHMRDFLNKDPRFSFWDCHEWIREFFAAMGAYLQGGEYQYSLEELNKSCDWWKFIGVTAEQLDMPKLVVGCPWFVDHPECAQIHLEPHAWAAYLSALSDEDLGKLLELRPQLARYKNVGKREGT